MDDDIIYHYLTFETDLPPVSNHRGSSASHDLPPPEPDLVPYTSPFLWSTARKSLITWLSCIATVFTAYTAGSISPPADLMASEWGVSRTAILVGITTFTTGFGIAPMVLAPFSEINGRYPVFAFSGLLFVLCQICTAVTRTYGGMLAARFFVGVGGSVFSTMVGGVISDIYHANDRNTPMSIFAAGALFGTGLGPLVSGLLAQHLHWRWVFYLQIITNSLMVASVILLFKETRGSVLLSRKAGALNKWYEEREKRGYIGVEMPIDEGEKKGTRWQRMRWKVKADEERETLAKMIGISLYRPFHMLITEPVVFWFSLWVSFSWAVLYLTFSAIPLVFTTNHGFDVQQNGLVFGAMCVGSILATPISIYSEKYIFRYGKLQGNPEDRLYFCCIFSICLPIGLFWFAWTSFAPVHWIVPTLAVGCATMGIFSIYLAVFNYLADVYHRYASSALAAQSCCRNLLGGVFPLVTVPLFDRLTFQGASSFLGGVAVLLTIVPWALVFYGTRIRARSKFAREIMSDQ